MEEHERVTPALEGEALELGQARVRPGREGRPDPGCRRLVAAEDPSGRDASLLRVEALGTPECARLRIDAHAKV